MLVLFIGLASCSESDVSSLKLKAVYNGTAFECNIWDVVPGEFGQELGQTIIGGKDYIYFLNRDSEIILLDGKGVADTLQITPEIQRRVGFMPGEVMGYCVAMNHIWIGSPVSDSIYKMSLDLVSVEAFHNGFVNDREDEGVFKSVGLLSSKRHEIVNCNGNLILPIYQHFEAAEKRDQVPNNYTTIGCFGASEAKLELKEEIAVLPQVYYDENMYFNSSSYCLKGDSLIVHYPYSDSIDIYSKAGLINRKELKCSKSNSVKSLKGLSLDIMAVKEHVLMHPRYVETIYDPYRNLYYRTYLVEVINEEGKISPHEKWILGVYDSQFRLAEELEFTAKDFSVNGVFVFPEGLLIRDFRSFDKEDPGKSQFELISWEYE